ncbi:MAG: XdhC family protein [Kosmotogaceae bacterium]
MSDNVKSILKKKNIVVLATVIDSKTSSFRRNGNMYALTSENEFLEVNEDTFGHFVKEGMLEAKRNARSFSDMFIESRKNAASSGGTCGERTKVFFNYIGEPSRIIVFGCGDLGIIFAKIMHTAGFDVLVVDDSETFLNRIDNKIEKKRIDYEKKETYPNIDEKDYCVVLTRGHQRDLEALKIIFSYNPKYIGMIGSSKKNEELHEEFINNGYTEKQWNVIRTPIGMEINASTPGEIAISIAAEIVALKNRVREE